MKKQETTIKWFWPKECQLHIFVGSYDEAEEKRREISNSLDDDRDLPEHNFGITRKIGKGREIFVWINEPEIMNSDGQRTLGQTLLHELIHVKQILEQTYFHKDDRWPCEFEAYYIQSMYEQACEDLKIRG